MKRILAFFLILAVQPVISGITFHSVLSSRNLDNYLPDRIPRPPVEKAPDTGPPAVPDFQAPYYRQSAGTDGDPRGNEIRRGAFIASVPEFELNSENIDEADKVVVIGCDGSVWESSAFVAGQKELAGTWIGYEESRTGEWSITFTYSGRFEIKGPDGEWHHGRYACDSKRDPKVLNLYFKESSNPTFVDQTSLMVYRADTNTLTCASSEPGVKTRPDTFTPANGVRVFVFTKKI